MLRFYLQGKESHMSKTRECKTQEDKFVKSVRPFLKLTLSYHLVLTSHWVWILQSIYTRNRRAGKMHIIKIK